MKSATACRREAATLGAAGCAHLKILLAEDVSMIRGALVALLKMERDLAVVADVDCGDLVLPAARRYRPDVAILDIDLPVIDGLTVATQLHDELPACRTLILTSIGRPGTFRQAIAARVSGFILKDSPPERLAEAVRSVAAGQRVFDPELAVAAWDVGENPLSDREVEVLRLAARGADAPEIAGSLHLSVGTVRNYLTTIVTKLNARNRVDAVRIAQEAGWIT